MRWIQTFWICLLLLAGACDKPSARQEQDASAKGVPAAGAGAGGQGDITLESASGMTARLTYAHAGKAAPKVFFTGGDGRDVSLADFAGRPLLVNLWATWCAPCKAEMPTIDALAQREAGRISVIAVNQDLQGARPAMDFFRAAGVRNLELYSDADNALTAAYGAISLPTTILYDSEGYEVWRVEGGLEWNDEEIAKLLREAL